MPGPTPQAGPMSQAEFAKLMRDKLRDKMPEIDKYTDLQVANMGFKTDPRLKGVVANPEYGDYTGANSAAYYNTINKKRGEESIAQGAINTLPWAGGVLGGTLAGGSTFGAGVPVGMGLGAAGGSELKDFLNKVLGMGDPNATPKSGLESLQDATVYGGTAGLSGPVLNTIGTGAGLSKDAVDTIRALIRLKMGGGGKLLDLLPEARATPKPTARPPSRYLPVSSGPEGYPVAEPEFIPPGLRKTGTTMEMAPDVPPPPSFNAPAPRLPLSRPPTSSGTGMKVDPNNIFGPPPKVGQVVPEGAAPPDTEGLGFTEGEFTPVPPKELPPATTIFEPEAHPNWNMKAIESPEAITESKMQNTIDAMNAEDAAVAPGPSKSEEDILHHYMQTTESMTPTLAKRLLDAGYTSHVDPETGHIIWRIVK